MGAIRSGLAIAALGLAWPALAQDTFSLPPGTATPTARPAGPVDTDAPVVRPRPTQTATPQPSATPSSAPPATAAPLPTATSRPPAARQTSAPRPAPASSTAAAVDPLALPGAATPAPATPLPTALATTVPAPVASQPATAPAEASDWAAFATGALVGALALLALVGGLLWRRRKSDAASQVEFEPPVVPAAPSQAPEPAASPLPDRAAAPSPEPSLAAPAEGLQISLEARRLDASLMATTLAYQLTLTNHSTAPLNALAIEGDMVAAHSSLPVEQQIANPEQKLELRHALVELAPGASAEFRGEMRLPLTAITPIRAGDAAYFVPLARLRVEAAQAVDGALVLAQTFVIGELPEQPGGALRPFRLDLGPRTFGKLGQRAVG